ncbi:MAG TPA: hypothetical protein PLS71_25465 [Leptospiraceae bacterium]|nr:hypothetical protein [Leptospiraceae bacterium]
MNWTAAVSLPMGGWVLDILHSMTASPWERMLTTIIGTLSL